jgi:L-ascorbate metabolism protein UlaG (beta-lactamase superfamily)
VNRTTVTTVWAVVATALLTISLAWPDRAGNIWEPVAQAVSVRSAQAQTQDAPAQLEWLGWQFFRLTSPRGKIILFNPALNDPAALFRNRESPLSLENVEAAHLVLVSAGHVDDQGMAVEVVRKTGAQLVTTFELSNWMVARGVETGKILRGGPGSRFEVDGIRIQVVHAVHGSGAPPLPGQPNLAVYGGTGLGFIVTLENGVKVYHAGSTALTQDLALYGRVYKPHVALLPTGCCMPPDEAAIGAELLMTDNPNLHSVFPQHHSSWAHPPAQQGAAFVRAVQAHKYRRGLTAFDPKPGQLFTINASGTRAR